MHHVTHFRQKMKFITDHKRAGACSLALAFSMFSATKLIEIRLDNWIRSAAGLLNLGHHSSQILKIIKSEIKMIWRETRN